MENLIVLLYTSASAHKSAMNRLAAYIHMQTQPKRASGGEDGYDEDVNAFVIVWKLWTKKKKKVYGNTVKVMPCLLCLMAMHLNYVEGNIHDMLFYLNQNAWNFTKITKTNWFKSCMCSYMSECMNECKEQSSMDKSTGEGWCSCTSSNKSTWRLLSSHAAVAGVYLRGELLGVAMP